MMVATNFERLVGYRTLDEGQVPVKAYCMAVFMAEFSRLPFVLQHSCSIYGMDMSTLHSYRVYRLCDRLTGADLKIKADGEGEGVGYISGKWWILLVHAHTPVGLDKQCTSAECTTEVVIRPS